MKKYYLRISGSIEGPYRVDEIHEMLTIGKVKKDDLCWTSGMYDWQRISLCLPGIHKSISIANSFQYLKLFSEDNLRQHFMIFTILWCVSYPLYIMNLQLLFVNILLFLSYSLGLLLIYRHWIIIQGEFARTSPGKAIFLIFVPVFNLYGFFVAIAGLAEDNNIFMDHAGIKGNRMSYNLALAYYVAIVLGLFLAIQVILSYSIIAMDTLYLSHAGNFILFHLSKFVDFTIMVMGYIFANQQKEAILAIIKYKKEKLRMDNLRDILFK